MGREHIQARTGGHTRLSIASKELFELGQRTLDEDMKRFFRLFQESTFEGSQAAARKMKKIAKGQGKHNQKFLLFHSLRFLAHSTSEMLLCPNSPFLVMLQFVDSNVLSETRTYQWKVRRGELCSSTWPIWQIVSTTQHI
jgi:hypothetical protein